MRRLIKLPWDYRTLLVLILLAHLTRLLEGLKRVRNQKDKTFRQKLQEFILYLKTLLTIV